MKLKVLYLYPEFLSLYGDRGNVEILYQRCIKRGINIEIKEVKYGDVLNSSDFKDINFIFMGGGSDLNQKTLYEDLLLNKKGFLSDYIFSGKCGLFICGAYQLLGNYYQTETGTKIQGLGIIDFHTINEGKENRSVSPVKLFLNPNVNDPIFKKRESRNLYGFVNHGGQTYLSANLENLGKVVKGFGNNRNSKFEGIIFQGIIGTYLHGPFLSLNPDFCDYLIKKSLNVPELKNLDNSLIFQARKLLK